jgi:MSHA biogenesis protein MshE
MRIQRIHLGKLLIDNGLISEEQLKAAIDHQNVTGQRLGKTLTEMNLVSEEKLLQLLSQQLEIPYVNLQNYSLKIEIVSKLGEMYARRFRAIVLKDELTSFLVGMADPQDIVAQDEIVRLLGRPINLAIVKEEELLHTIEVLYRKTAEISSYAEELSTELKENEFTITQLTESASATDAPVVKLLKSIFEDASQQNASDIHIEPDETLLRIRTRIDGILHEQVIKEKQVIQALTLRLKLMAGLNITEKRIPQDGRFSIKVKDKTFDIRLSTLPVQFGESVVMRLLGRSAELLNLNVMGLPAHVLEVMRKLIHYPNGLIVITGPTGSGKTTTLYGALSELNTPEKKIVTVEDPVEYRMTRINQVQIQPAIDLTFARALRAILRQDPDIIMIGELRDQETVGIAIRSAMTGHLVLTTLHTNDAISSALRLMDMGAESYLVAAVLRGILAQRLVRRNCVSCCTEFEMTAAERAWVEILAPDKVDHSFKKGKGCNYCHESGYKGQVGIYELLEMTAPLVEELRKNNTAEFVRLAKIQPGYESLAVNGLALAATGLTTLEEIMRVTGDTF